MLQGNADISLVLRRIDSAVCGYSDFLLCSHVHRVGLNTTEALLKHHSKGVCDVSLLVRVAEYWLFGSVAVAILLLLS